MPFERASVKVFQARQLKWTILENQILREPSGAHLGLDKPASILSSPLIH